MTHWHQWVSTGANKLELEINLERLPYLLRTLEPQVYGIRLFCEVDASIFTEQDVSENSMLVENAFVIHETAVDLTLMAKTGDRCFLQSKPTSLGQPLDFPLPLDLALTASEFEPSHLKELVVVFQFFAED